MHNNTCMYDLDHFQTHLDFTFPVPILMRSSLHHQTCCCCPKRVDVKGTYKTIGSGTIDKFTPHARDTVTENVTRACYKCYAKYTRPPKKKVIHAVFQHTCIISYSSYVRTHTACIVVWYTLWNLCMFCLEIVCACYIV